MSTDHPVSERIGHAVTRQAQPALTPNVPTLSSAVIFASHRPFIQAVRSFSAAMPIRQMFNVVMLDAGVV